MKLTRHNGRSGRDGAFTARHNDRQFDLKNAAHIDPDRTENNVYWDVYHGVRTFSEADCETELTGTFDEIEKRFYSENYQTYVYAQNKRNEKNRHTERNRTVEDIRRDRKTCPEESIYQIGTMQDHISPKVLLEIATEFMDTMEEKFGTHVHILDWALHCDESSPHIHERHVFDCLNKYGELVPQQDRALEELGFDLPYPDKKPSRYNHRKMSFDAECRKLLFDIAKEHGLELEEEPTHGSRKHVEKEEYIIQQQKKTITDQQETIDNQHETIEGQQETIEDQQETIADQQEIIDDLKEVIAGQDNRITGQKETLDDLNMRVEDIETFIDEVSQTAYDRAVDVVAEAACVETQKEDIQIISEYNAWVQQPERQAPKEFRDYTAKRLDSVIDRIQKSARKILENVIHMLRTPKVRSPGIEKIKAKTRESIYRKLNKNKVKVAEREADRPEKFIERQNQQVI